MDAGADRRSVEAGHVAHEPEERGPEGEEQRKRCQRRESSEREHPPRGLAALGRVNDRDRRPRQASRATSGPRTSVVAIRLRRGVRSSVASIASSYGALETSPRRPRVRTCVRALGEPDNRRGRADPSARVREASSRPPLRCARGPRDALLRGPGEVRAEPRARAVADAVPVDDQPVQRLLACLRVLRRGRQPSPACRRTRPPDRRSAARRRDLRHRAPRNLSALRPYRGARTLEDREGGLQDRPRGRDRARRERRSPVPHDAWLEVRHRRAAWPGASPSSDDRSELLGTGQFAGAPAHCDDYRRGYLCGMVRGDGHFGSYHYERAGRTSGDVHRFRLALIDDEALDRTQEYLAIEATSERRASLLRARGRVATSSQRDSDVGARPGASASRS